MSIIVPIVKFFNVVTVLLVLFFGVSVVKAETFVDFEAPVCKSTSRGMRCKNPKISSTKSRKVALLRNDSFNTKNNCKVLSRGTRCKHVQDRLALIKSIDGQHESYATEKCQNTSRGTRCYS